MHPIPNPAEGVDGTARRRTNNRAVTIVTTSMMGVSISSAILVPTRETTHSVWMVPRTKPIPEHEPEIEPSSFQNRHDSLLSLSTPPIVATLPRATRTTIGHEQNKSRVPRLRPF